MLAPCLVGVLLITALVAQPATALAQGQAAVTGTVIYLERIALPPTAVVTVQLQDVSRADATATVLAEQKIDTAGNGPPYAFSLSYDPAQIQDTMTYAVRATIWDGDKLLFTSTERYAVITRGNPTTNVQVRVSPVGNGDTTTGGATTLPASPAPTNLPTTSDSNFSLYGLLLLAVVAVTFISGIVARRLAR